jgi:large subunit ribosomal protein L7e
MVPESVLKKQKMNEKWALAKKLELEAAEKKRTENVKLIFDRVKHYAKEYDEKV